MSGHLIRSAIIFRITSYNVCYTKLLRYIFPVTKTFTKYIVPLRYGDEFICKAILIDASIKIVMNFEIERVKDNVV